MGRTIDETLNEATDAYLKAISLNNLPDAATIAAGILDDTRTRIQMANAALPSGSSKWRCPKKLNHFQIAKIINTIYHVALVNVGKKSVDSIKKNDDSTLLCIYQETGPDAGVYIESDAEIRNIARGFSSSLTNRQMDEIMCVLKDIAPKVSPCNDLDLIPVNNGVFNYKTKTLLPFSPDYVFLSKSRVNYNPLAKNITIHNDGDGTDWDVESWMNELSDDSEVVHVLWQVLGAILRPNVAWDKSVWFYSESGNNGKGTLCELMRELIGDDNYASIPLADFGKDFMLEPLLHAQAIITDENDVGTYVDKAANLKAIITGDPVSVNRKFKKPVSYCFRGLVVQCLNEMPRIRDKSDSFFRRQLFIAFTKCFTGKERKYIKHDYLHRPEVLEYVMFKVLNMDYYSFDVPAACQDALNEYKEFNDPVRQFLSEMLTQLKWDLVPFPFLYDLYSAWYQKNFAGRTELKSSTVFVNDVAKLLPEYPGWQCEDKRRTYRSKGKMDDAEPLIAEYNLTNWMDPRYTASKDMDKRCHPVVRENYRGIVRG